LSNHYSAEVLCLMTV